MLAQLATAEMAELGVGGQVGAAIGAAVHGHHGEAGERIGRLHVLAAEQGALVGGCTIGSELVPAGEDVLGCDLLDDLLVVVAGGGDRPLGAVGGADERKGVGGRAAQHDAAPRGGRRACL